MPQLIIMRHGLAEAITNSDAERALTADGEQHCIEAANALLVQLPDITQQLKLFHSPYRRTTQTARLVAKQLAVTHDQPITPVESNKLISEQSPASVIKWLQSHSVAANNVLMLVSHQPLVSSLLALLIEGAGDYATMRNYPMWPASVAVLDIEQLAAGCAELISLNHYAR
jgi:phosphohistidine phosphatase SixA